jgi:SPP1 family predicted phage head-tail adaptor
MTAGQLRNRVAFQQELRADDGGGGSEVTWPTAFTVWGGFRPERGQERLEAGRLQSAVAGVLTVRATSQTDQIKAEDWRCTIDGDPYNIRSIVDRDMRGKFYEMTVERGVAT